MKWAVSQKGRLTAVSEPVIVALSLVKDDDFTIKRDASNSALKDYSLSMKWAVSQKGRLTAVSEPVIVALSLVKDDDFTIKRDASKASNKKGAYV